MELRKFKKFNYINASKKFCNHFHYICLHYRHTHDMFRVYLFIVIVLDCTISFSLWWTMVKMAIYTQKCEQKWLKINNRGVGIKMSWVEKNRKINNREGNDYSGLESIYICIFVYVYILYIYTYVIFSLRSWNKKLCNLLRQVFI